MRRKPSDHVDLVHSEVPALVAAVALIYFCSVLAIIAAMVIGGGA